MRYSIKFKIAEIIFDLTSCYPRIFKENRDFLRRYGAFIYRGKREARISISVAVVEKFPAISSLEVFAVYEPKTGFERWQLYQNKNEYVYQCPIPGREVRAYIKKNFSRARALVLPFKGKFAWDVKDIVYDLMQIMLINYFAYRRNGLILHAAAVKEKHHALVFPGRSGSGKSTTARLWHRHSRAAVLNDDRVIIRKTGKDFSAYSGPWHGEFGHKVTAVSDQAPLKGLFIIEHARKNICRTLSLAEAFRALYPTLFTGFWDRQLMNNTLSLCAELIGRVSVARLGFVKDKKVIPFMRQIIDQAK